jgi:hypothetical protein
MLRQLPHYGARRRVRDKVGPKQGQGFGIMRYKRVVVSQYGGPEVITTTEEDIPTPRAGEVRVKVLAAGVGLPDVLAREGVHPETPHVPYTPGWDLIGTIDQLGGGRDGLRASPASRRDAHSRMLRAIPLPTFAQACPRACRIGPSGGCRLGVELHHRLSNAASIS